MGIYIYKVSGFATEREQRGDNEGSAASIAEMRKEGIWRKKRKRKERSIEEGCESGENHEQGSSQEENEIGGTNERERTRRRGRHDPPKDRRNSSRDFCVVY